MRYEVRIEGTTRQVDVRRASDGGWWISIDGGPERQIEGAQLGATEWRLTEDGATRVVAVAMDGESADLQVRGHAIRAEVVDPRAHVAMDGPRGGAGVVATPMPGLVSRILVAEGQRVDVGEVLVVVEAMKMENEFKSRISGVVRTIHVVSGSPVDAHALLVTVEAP